MYLSHLNTNKGQDFPFGVLKRFCVIFQGKNGYKDLDIFQKFNISFTCCVFKQRFNSLTFSKGYFQALSFATVFVRKVLFLMSYRLGNYGECASQLQQCLDPGLTEGVLCNYPCQLVCWSICPSAFRYLGDFPLAFVIFCIKLGHHKSTKMTEPDFWMGHKWRKTPFLGNL